MNNKISYGPHLFPGGPEMYIRENKLKKTTRDAHEKIRQTLMAGFDNQNPDSIFSQLSKRFRFAPDTEVHLDFMNYGNTELVYLASIGYKEKFAALINQPHTPLGRVKEEFNNLQRLREIDPTHVIEPFAYFGKEEKGHELYAAEYVDNALCVAHNGGGHGIYNPIPRYHFEKFSPEMSSQIKAHMIALLVNYYDQEQKKGLAKTEISGNDFMLNRNFDKNNPTTIQDNIKLIAARGRIEASLDEYLDILKKEFLLGTRRYRKPNFSGEIMVNTRSEEAMSEKEIKQGIELGLQLRQQHIDNI